MGDAPIEQVPGGMVVTDEHGCGAGDVQHRIVRRSAPDRFLHDRQTLCRIAAKDGAETHHHPHSERWYLSGNLEFD
jgi:hypothetical protein